MRKIVIISMAVSLACFSFTTNAKQPHPASAYDVSPVTCTCSWVEPSNCEVSWTDAGAPSYGVDVEFEAEWTADEVKMQSKAELDLDDNWTCDGVTCLASGDFSLPDYTSDADTSDHTYESDHQKSQYHKSLEDIAANERTQTQAAQNTPAQRVTNENQ